MPITTVPRGASIATTKTLGNLTPHPANIGKIVGAKMGITAPRKHFARGGMNEALGISQNMFQPINAFELGVPNADVSFINPPQFKGGKGAPPPPQVQPQKEPDGIQQIAEGTSAANNLTKMYNDPDGIMKKAGNFLTGNHGSGFGGIASGPDAATSNSIFDSSNAFAPGTSIDTLAADATKMPAVGTAIDASAAQLAATTAASAAVPATATAAAGTAAAASTMPEWLTALLAFFAKGGAVPGYADGGDVSKMPGMMKQSGSAETYHHSGLLNSSGPGRTDTINTNVPAGAYVIPADVVSGLGEGNTLAGSAVIDKMFGTAPYGIRSPKINRGRLPSPPSDISRTEPNPSVDTSFIDSAGKYAKGGDAKSKAPVVVAGGEHVLSPQQIINKFGSLRRGHKILDEWVVQTRQKTAKEMMSLAPPVGSKVKKK